MNGTGKLALFATASVLCGCSTSSPTEDVDAVITSPTPESHSELERIVSEALDGASVTIAGDALTRDSLLIIERVRPVDAQGRPLSGRDLGRPERFRLVLSGSECLLVREADGSRRVLANSTCAAR